MAQQDNIFRLDLGSGVPLYRQIIDQVLLSISDGRLEAGMQLPTVRQLAVDLAVNLNTVAKAYREMEIRGIVETQQGTGTFIASRKPDPRRASEKKKVLDQLVDRYIAIAMAKGILLEELIEAMAQRATRKGRRES